MGYIVIQFIKWKGGKSVLAVPESWVVEAYGMTCFFPRVNAEKLIKQQAIVKADWKKCHIKKSDSTLSKGPGGRVKGTVHIGHRLFRQWRGAGSTPKRRATMESREDVNNSRKSGNCNCCCICFCVWLKCVEWFYKNFQSTGSVLHLN